MHYKLVHYAVTAALSIVIIVFFLKQRRKCLSNNERFNKLLIEYLPYGVFVTNLEKEIIFANSAAILLLGANTEFQVVGRKAKDFVHPGYIRPDREYVKRFKNNKDGIPLGEVDLIDVGGRIISADLTAIPFLYERKKTVLFLARDVTAEKKAEELQKKVDENAKKLNETLETDKLKTDFFANLSHELRTPLNMIFSTLQLFELYMKDDREEIDRKKLKKYMSIMKQNCYRLLRLVNNLIDTTKIDSGFFEMQLQSCNIISIVEEITLSAAEYIKAKGIDLMFDTDVEEKLVECDPDKIERIILNLLSNAVKFTGTGGTIAVTIHDIGDNVIITVKDTGIGIERDKLNIIFERFKQVDKSLTHDSQGSGIGLSLVKALVEMHNGTISANSEYGRGSEFIIKLPARNISRGNILETEKCTAENNIHEGHIERINIEFSDIYIRD